MTHGQGRQKVGTSRPALPAQSIWGDPGRPACSPRTDLLWHKPQLTCPGWDSYPYARVPALSSNLTVRIEVVNPFILVASITCG